MAYHGNMAAMPDDSRDPVTPAPPEKKCPFCEGYASFLTALTGASDASMIDAERIGTASNSLDDAPVEQFTGRPQNRGPPITL